MSLCDKPINKQNYMIENQTYLIRFDCYQIKHIGGESTLNTGKKRMFPDLYLFGDISRTQVLQGWEIKMPDVSINNDDFISDAKRKADILDVNNCVIWNFITCILYCKNDGVWVEKKSWNSCHHIKTRADVETYRKDWEHLAVEVLQDLNDFFLSGDLKSASLGEILTDTVFQELIK